MSIPAYSLTASPALGKILVVVPTLDTMTEGDKQELLRHIKSQAPVDMPIELTGPDPDPLPGETWEAYAFRAYGHGLNDLKLRKDRPSTCSVSMRFPVPANVARDSQRRNKR